MKKVLLLFALLVGAISASAGSYTIVFKTAANDNSNAFSSAANFKNEIAENADKVTSFTDFSYVYQGKNGIKLSSSKKNGSFTINLSAAGQVEATSIVINAAGYGSDNSSISINGVNKSISGTSLADYTYDLNGSKITTINVSATKRSYIKSITVNYKDAVQATHVAIDPAEGGTFENSKDVTLTALDAEGNAVEGAKVFYTIGDETQQEGTSPVTFNLTKSATVKAWVGTETPATATFTITVPEVQPGNPVFSANGTTLTDEEATLPYGTELNITAENAVSLEVLAGEDVQEIQGNSYTITITDDTEIMVTAHNGSLSSEGMISVKLADPTLTVMAGEQVIENNGVYEIKQGSVISVSVENAQSISVTDSDNKIIDLVNNSFEPTKDDIYTVKAIAGSKVTEITFSVELTIPEYQNVTATFDFVNNAYGLGEHSSSVETGTYEPADKDIAEKDVNLLLTGKFRRWNKGDAYDFRTYDASSITVKVPVNCYITNITFSGKSIGNISYGNSKVNNVSFTSADKVKEVIFKTTSNQINTITVNYVKDNYTATATVEVDEENPYEYAYGHANVLVFKPQILFNGNPIEDTEYANYEVRLNGVVLGQADQAELLNYFDYDKKNVFTLHKGEKTINVEVKWPEIDVNPVISEVEYLKEDDGKMHAIYYVMPENNPQGFNWSVVCNNADMLYWNGKTGAACQFNEVGDQAENAPQALMAHIKYPFAVRKVSSASQTIKLMAENDDIEIREYHAPDTSLSTADVAKPNENNTSCVADVAVDQDSEVEFFNLQGVRVEGELTPGLYIRRQGNRASKVVVK